ncbi:MAG: ABC transporter permease subunit [Myxococcota bacterium]
MTHAQRIEALWATRPRSPFLRSSLLVLSAMMVVSWGFGDFDWSGLFSPRRVANLRRFLEEIRPYPVQGVEWDWSVVWGWAVSLFQTRGAAAASATLAISVLAIVLAAVGCFAWVLPAARTFATPEPFLPEGREPSRLLRALSRGLITFSRGVLILLRSLPEYVWVFLILSILGPTPWAAVLALALHNTGILGRLTAETVENVDPRSPAALRGLGASRRQIAVIGVLPEILPRFLLYFFYRWETCVREATVVGLLGIVSLGYWVEDARTRGQYDVLLFLVLLGALIVLAGDFLSTLVRRTIREAG